MQYPADRVIEELDVALDVALVRSLLRDFAQLLPLLPDFSHDACNGPAQCFTDKAEKTPAKIVDTESFTSRRFVQLFQQLVAGGSADGKTGGIGLQPAKH